MLFSGGRKQTLGADGKALSDHSAQLTAWVLAPVSQKGMKLLPCLELASCGFSYQETKGNFISGFSHSFESILEPIPSAKRESCHMHDPHYPTSATGTESGKS